MEGNFLRRNLLIKGTQNREGNVKPNKKFGIGLEIRIGIYAGNKIRKTLTKLILIQSIIDTMNGVTNVTINGITKLLVYRALSSAFTSLVLGSKYYRGFCWEEHLIKSTEHLQFTEL